MTVQRERMLVPARCATHTESVCQCVFSVDLCRLFMTAATCSLSSLHPELLLLLTVRLLVCSAVCCAGTSDHLWLCLHAKHAELQGHLKQPAERRDAGSVFLLWCFPKTLDQRHAPKRIWADYLTNSAKCCIHKFYKRLCVVLQATCS